MRRRLVPVVLAAAAIVVAAGIAVERHRSRDIRGSSSIEYTPPAPAAVARPRSRKPVAWPTYGFDPRRSRVLEGVPVRPPYRRIWTFHGRALLEFPPAVAGGRLFLPTFDGRFYGIDARTGRAVWRYDSGRCSWASPAVSGSLVFETFLSAEPDCRGERIRGGGTLVAFDTSTGAVHWTKGLAPTESSPLVVDGLVVVGDWSGRVVAAAARTGRVVWLLQLGAPVKDSAAAAGGIVYVASYDGRLYALDARTGAERWRASAQPRLGGRGAFYSSPTIAYGRVYIGSTDGKVYSFGAHSGKLRWSHRTGGYVYASPAVWRGLVLIGSYDGTFYAFDAASGDVVWRFRANGAVSGAATVLDGLVYFSTLRERTYALDAASGRLVWSWPDGKYSPVVSDGRRLYLVGLGRLYGLVPRVTAG